MDEKRIYKFIVSGPVGSGKTTFIRTISEIPVVETEVKSTIDIGKETTTVAMDFGMIRIDAHEIHLYGTPGQDRFAFMWEVLSNNAIGIILLIDSTDPSNFPNAKRILNFLLSRLDVPFMVGATKRDIEPSWDEESIADYLRIDRELVKPVICTDRESVLKFLKTFLNYYKKEVEPW